MSVTATPTTNQLALRAANFESLAEALDYAAQGDTGCNFYDGRARLYEALPYSKLAQDAQDLARALISRGFRAGDRIVIVAETHPNFLRGFFACQYAGLIPVPVPVPIQLGSRASYIRKTRDLLITAHANAVLCPESVLPMINEACDGIEMKFVGNVEQLLVRKADPSIALTLPQPEDTAYIQFTSGSTRFPRGVVITQSAVMNNLRLIIEEGVKINRQDRINSWLPFYHDMGLVGLILVPVASQTSVDYLDTRDFAMRPRRWLELISLNRSTISFSPPFGYELVERRLRENEQGKYELSQWRVAGVGAETIRPEPLLRFAENLKDSGFDASAFVPCYGMAECSLAISFAKLDKGLSVETVDGDLLSEQNVAFSISEEQNPTCRIARYVDCGSSLSNHEMEVRNETGDVLPEREVGTIFVRGPSVMSCYYDNTEETANTLSDDGWLNTGDLGFLFNNRIFITGREKDLIIVNGRNIWPQDIEYLAEMQPEVRTGDALAFSATGFDDETTVVVVVQCRERANDAREHLVNRIEVAIKEELGIGCFVKLVPPHTLPRTSSGKLSRSTARRNYMERNAIGEHTSPEHVQKRSPNTVPAAS